jgi:hypothetical protein
MRLTRFAVLMVWAVPLALCAFARQAASAEPSATLDLPAYTAELARWSASAARLREHPEEAAPLRKQLPDHWTVVAQQQTFTVPTQWLGAALDRLAANPKLAAETSREIAARIKAMAQDAQDLAQLTTPSSAQARGKLDDILKRSEYRSVRAAEQGETFWDVLSDWFWKLLDKIFTRASGHPKVTRVLLWAVVIALGLVFLGWLIYALANIQYSNLSFRRRKASEEVAAPAGTWRDWVQNARAAAGRGDYRDAVRIIYGAAVRRIGEAGTWQVDPARTHREYVRLLPANSTQRPALVAITTCFERVWYGRAEASATDYEAALTELESLP